MGTVVYRQLDEVETVSTAELPFASDRSREGSIAGKIDRPLHFRWLTLAYVVLGWHTRSVYSHSRYAPATPLRALRTSILALAQLRRLGWKRYLRKMRSIVHGTLADRSFTRFFLLKHVPVLDKDSIPDPDDVC
jgi:hypothetical protein